MAELDPQPIFINERHSTTSLRSEASRLVHVDLELIERAKKTLRIVGMKYRSDDPGLFHWIRNALRPIDLPSRIERKWEDAQTILEHNLKSCGIMKSPDNVINMRMSEHLKSVDRFDKVDDALGYFEFMETRLQMSQSRPFQSRVSTVGYAGFAVLENRILKRAVQDGVYLLYDRFNPDSQLAN